MDPLDRSSTHNKLHSSPYEKLGGDEKVRELVDKFYDYMDSLQEAATIRALHPANLDTSREKLYLFLSGWLGGPSLYVEKYGHPMLRARHLPFSIGSKERDQWLMCMNLALNEMKLESIVRDTLKQSFRKTADHMRNQSEIETAANP